MVLRCAMILVMTVCTADPAAAQSLRLSANMIHLAGSCSNSMRGGQAAVEENVQDFEFVLTSSLRFLPVRRSWTRDDLAQDQWSLGNGSTFSVALMEEQHTSREEAEKTLAHLEGQGRVTRSSMEDARGFDGTIVGTDLYVQFGEARWAWTRIVGLGNCTLLRLEAATAAASSEALDALIAEVMATFSAAASVGNMWKHPVGQSPYEVDLGSCRAIIPMAGDVAMAKAMHELPGRDVGIDLRMSVKPLADGTPKALTATYLERLARQLASAEIITLIDASVQGGREGHDLGMLVSYTDNNGGSRERWVFLSVLRFENLAISLEFTSDHPKQEIRGPLTQEESSFFLDGWSVEASASEHDATPGQEVDDRR